MTFTFRLSTRGRNREGHGSDVHPGLMVRLKSQNIVKSASDWYNHGWCIAACNITGGWPIATCYYFLKLSTCLHDLMFLLWHAARMILQSNTISSRSCVRTVKKIHLFKPGWKYIKISPGFLLLNVMVNNKDRHAISHFNSCSPGCKWLLRLHELYSIVF